MDASSPPFDKPLGLFLQGGGALGAWQAGVLEALSAARVDFDHVQGFSIGALNGSAVAFGRLPETLALWRELDGWALKFAPRLNPFALCSVDPLKAFLDGARDEDTAKSRLVKNYTVVSASVTDGVPVNARFTPGGRDGWDGPLVEHAVASCAIPVVFPPVDLDYRGRRVRLVDGGVPVAAPLDFSPLAASAAVLVVEMVRADEVGTFRWTPWRMIDQKARDVSRRLVDEAVKPLIAAGKPVYRLCPSRALKPMMLDFRARGLSQMLAQGAADGRAFLASPASFLAR
jgi:NTE family protein